MKLKKLKVQDFVHKDELGHYRFKEVEILFDPAVSEITVDTFDQNQDNYFLSDKEIERLSLASARRFYNKHCADILSGEFSLTSNHIQGIKNVIKVNNSELADLVGMDRSSVTRILKGNQNIQKDLAMSVMELLKDELDTPGFNRIKLSHIRSDVEHTETKLVNVPAIYIAEAFVSIFKKRESPLTHLKLQKLLYYAQGIGFGRHNCKLFAEDLYAWEHGPVVEEVYEKYKSHGSRQIEVEPTVDVKALLKDRLIADIINETISLYGKYDAWKLREMTHEEHPWLETPLSEKITTDKMISFFKHAIV